jgi:hypothetical protein
MTGRDVHAFEIALRAMGVHRANRPLPIFDGPLLFALFKDFLISFNILLMHKE